MSARCRRGRGHDDVGTCSGPRGSHVVQDGGCSHVVDVHEDFQIDRATGLLYRLDRWLLHRVFVGWPANVDGWALFGSLFQVSPAWVASSSAASSSSRAFRRVGLAVVGWDQNLAGVSHSPWREGKCALRLDLLGIDSVSNILVTAPFVGVCSTPSQVIVLTASTQSLVLPATSSNKNNYNYWATTTTTTTRTTSAFAMCRKLFTLKSVRESVCRVTMVLLLFRARVEPRH